MKTDLFNNPSKQDLLKRFMQQKGFFASHTIIQWGCSQYYNRANRTKQEFLHQGLIRMLPKDEKLFRGFKCKDAVYEWVGKVND